MKTLPYIGWLVAAGVIGLLVGPGCDRGPQADAPPPPAQAAPPAEAVPPPADPPAPSHSPPAEATPESPAEDATPQQSDAASPAPTEPTETTAPEAVEWRGIATKIKVKNGAGGTEFSVKPKDDGAKLVNAQEQELARYNMASGKLKIKDPDDNVLGYVVPGGHGLKLEDPTQQRTLYHLIDQGDGDWKLEDGQQHLIYKLKLREYGFEIETPDEASLYKIKTDGDKTSLRDANDKTTLYTNDPASPLAFACLGLDAIEDVRLRSALFTMVCGRP